MIPILYDHYETDFTSQGVGLLTDCISCEVTEVINGEYELEMDYPVSGRLFQRMIAYGGIIAVEHDHNGDIQPFDIYGYSAPIDGVVTFHAHHISYRLSNVIIGWLDGGERPSGQTPGEFFNSIAETAVTDCPFTFTDYTGYEPQAGRFVGYSVYTSVRDAFLNGYRPDDEVGTKSLLTVFPGEFKWDRFNVEYYRKRGQSNGVQIRYGKNMTDVNRERSTSDIVSAVFPFWVKADEQEGTMQIEMGGRVISPKQEVQFANWDDANTGIQMETPDGEPYYFGAADVRAAALDLSDQFDTTPTQADLEQAALDWMSKNSTWRAFDSIEVNFADLYASDEYEDIRDLEKCAVGDYVDIIYPDLGIAEREIEILSATYDVLNDAFIAMEIGEIRPTYAQVLLETLNGGKNQ